MAQVESDRRDPSGAGVQGFVRKQGACLIDVFAGQFEGVDDGPEDSGQVRMRSAKPGFGLGHKHILPQRDAGGVGTAPQAPNQPVLATKARWRKFCRPSSIVVTF